LLRSKLIYSKRRSVECYRWIKCPGLCNK